MLRHHKITTYLTPLLLLALLAKPLWAEHKKPRTWDGTSANLGLDFNTGDTNSKDLNFGAIIQYTHKKWSNNVNLNYQMSYSDHIQSKSIFNGTENINYYFSDNKKTYVSGNINGISDIKSDFRYTLVTSLMYGRTLKHNKRWDWTVQAGPGYRYNAAYEGNPNYTRPVGVILSNVTWNINKWGVLAENARFEFGNPYNYYQSTSSLTNKLYNHLALQISFQISHYSALPAYKTITALTDTTTLASIVYNL